MITDRLKGKVSLITGAASGIARATALRFSQEGGLLALVDLNEDGLKATAQTLGDQGTEVAVFTADVSRSEAVKAAITGAIERFGHLDVLFNAVGVSGRRWGDGPVDTCTEEAWERVL